MAIFVDILVGVERKSRIWRVGFISIAVLTVSEVEISEFSQIYVSLKDEFSVFSYDHMRFVTRNLDYGVDVLVLPDAVQYALIYRFMDLYGSCRHRHADAQAVCGFPGVFRKPRELSVQT